MNSPVPPIEWGRPAAEVGDVFPPRMDRLDSSLLDALAATGAAVSTAAADRAESSRDWWPLALRWALHGLAPARPAAVVRPADTAQVARVLELASKARVPVTAAGGRSGVCGGAVPVSGGIALDCCGLAGIEEVDERSLLVTVRAGTFGPDLDGPLRTGHGLTIGHFPQSFDLATVGGWLACRGAGQYSTRYGKIEDIVAGLEVVLASGRVVRTGSLAGAGPRAATGPDLTQLFVGSEGVLGVITAAALRAHPLPAHERREAWAFPSFTAGLEALRLALREQATPAVVRLYDEAESGRSFERPGTNVLVALDEGSEEVVEAAMGILSHHCYDQGGEPLGPEPVARWLDRRNDVSSLAPLTRAGIVVDTIEVAASWSRLGALYANVLDRLRAIDGCLAASAHESHAYPDGACLYFSFAGRGPDPGDDTWAGEFSARAWDAVMEAALERGASISHHHGIGLVRSPYLRRALGEGFAVLEALKSALDPAGILNPGKLGLPSPFGAVPQLSGGPGR